MPNNLVIARAPTTLSAMQVSQRLTDALCLRMGLVTGISSATPVWPEGTPEDQDTRNSIITAAQNHITMETVAQSLVLNNGRERRFTNHNDVLAVVTTYLTALNEFMRYSAVRSS